jgi:GTP cyclohydrolase I
MAQFIRALGLDPADEPELHDTPSRVVDLYMEAFAGLVPGDEPEIVTFPHEGKGDLVAVRGLTFHSMCVHHFAPFFGEVHIAYLPSDRIIGISGAGKLVDFYARRPQLQERMTAQIADHLERLVAPRGIGIRIEGRHMCMEMRGTRKSALVETRVVRGELASSLWAGALDRPDPTGGPERPGSENAPR